MKSSIYYHFTEIRTRFIYLIFSLIITFSVSSFFSYELLYLVIRNHRKKFIFTYLSEAFYTNLKVCLFFSFFCLIPLIIYHIWCFFLPSYFLKEKKQINYFLSIFFILLAVSFGIFYFGFLPFWYQFFTSFQVASDFVHIELEARIESYINFFFSLFLTIIVLCQIPFIFFLFIKKKAISVSFLSQNRSFFFVIFLLVAAFFSPPDGISQVVFAIGLFIWYELLLFFGFFLEKKDTVILIEAPMKPIC